MAPSPSGGGLGWGPSRQGDLDGPHPNLPPEGEGVSCYCAIFNSLLARDRSVLELVGDASAVLLELGDHLLVQPDVHRRRVVGVAAVAELLGELLACGEAAVE